MHRQIFLPESITFSTSTCKRVPVFYCRVWHSRRQILDKQSIESACGIAHSTVASENVPWSGKSLPKASQMKAPSAEFFITGVRLPLFTTIYGGSYDELPTQGGLITIAFMWHIIPCGILKYSYLLLQKRELCCCAAE